jgi:hypothetical protein
MSVLGIAVPLGAVLQALREADGKRLAAGVRFVDREDMHAMRQVPVR